MASPDDTLESLIALAMSEAQSAGAESLEPMHLLVAACRLAPPELLAGLAADGVDHGHLRRLAQACAAAAGAPGGKPGRISSRARLVLDDAKQRAGERPVTATLILCGLLLRPDRAVKALIQELGLPVAAIARRFAIDASPPPALIRPPAPAPPPPPAPPPEAGPPKRSPTPTLDAFGKDYTALARAGKLDPVIGRDDEIKQVVRVLLRKSKSNAVLLGDAGVGKTAIVEGLALRAAAADAAPEIRGLRVVELMLSAVVGGTKYRGEFEERLQKILVEAASDPELVIFLDELHLLVGAGRGGGVMDAANILKPALARGGLRVIGATTAGEYREHIEADAALERRFQPVRVDEPTPDAARAILRGLRPTLEAHHRLRITDEAIDAAVELTVRHLPGRRLPDKARDALDQAASARRFPTLRAPQPGQPDQPIELGRDDIARVVTEWTGIPAARLDAGERLRVLGLEDTLRARVTGQDEAVRAVAEVVRTAFAGLARPGRPRGVLLFLGPTGVGKTELAKALAEALFDDEKALLRFDMSEYHDKWTVQRLLGAPPGYLGHEEGGQLTNAIRRTPYAVVLFDEVEKADPRVTDIFLQVFDDGRLTDSHGRVADFSNTIIVLTSNLLSARAKAVGFHAGAGEAPAPAQDEDGLREALARHFRPELVNRIGRLVAFNPLRPEDLERILDKLLRGLAARTREQRLTVTLDAGARAALLALGYSAAFGARELERVFEKWVARPLADGMLAGTFPAGSAVRVEALGEGVVLKGGG